MIFAEVGLIELIITTGRTVPQMSKRELPRNFPRRGIGDRPRAGRV
jgi:hypothetical protein